MPASRRPACFHAAAALLFYLLAPLPATAQVIAVQPQVADVMQVARTQANETVDGHFNITINNKVYVWQRQPLVMWPLTGWNPPDPRQQYQVSVDPHWTSTGIQAQGDVLGINISSWSIPAALAQRTTGAITYGVRLGKQAIPLGGKCLRVSSQMLWATSSHANGGVSNYAEYVTFRDRVTRRRLAVGAQLADSRGWNWPQSRGYENARYDAFGMPFVVGTIGYAGVIRPVAGAYQGAPDRTWKPYAFDICEGHLANALNRVNSIGAGLSTDPKAYDVTQVIGDPEIHCKSGQTCHIGVSVRQWKVEML